MYKFIVFLSIALASSICMKAQGITGVVTGNAGNPVAYATVSLLHSNDSSYIAGALSSEDGAFSFDGTPADKLVRVSYVGYKTLILPAEEKMTISLQPSEKNIEEVTVTSTRPTFKLTKGMFVANIQGTVFSKLGNVTDVLQQLPMMDINGISVLGRGEPLIYINNRQMRDKSELDRITGDMIKDIKIDMSPGAKYGSSVRAVIFITTVRPVGEGLGGMLNMQESVSDSWNTAGRLNLNYRKKKLDVFLSTSYNTFSDSRYDRQDAFNFQYRDKLVNADYTCEGIQASKRGYVRVGANYQLTQKQSLGAAYSFSRLFSNSSDIKYQNRMETDGISSHYATSSHDFSQNGTHNVSAYYENKLSDKLAFNVDGVYARNEANNRRSVAGTQSDSGGDFVPVKNSQSDMVAVKTVLTSSVAGAKLEYGFEATYTRFMQKYNVENSDYTGVLRTNDNESRQSAANVFANYSQSLGKLYMQLGLKYEYADYDYYVSGKLRDESCRTYHRVLPSASFSYNLNRLSLMLSYNIYMSNPSYSQLDEGLQYVSGFQYSKGNSSLRPTYNHEVSLNASFGNVQFICNYTHKKDAVISWYDSMEEIPAVVSSSFNHSYNSMYAGLLYSPTLFKIWKTSWNLWAYRQWLTCGGQSYNRPQAGLQWKNLIVLPKSWYFILNASGNLRGNAMIYMSKPSVRANIAVQKNIKKWKINLAVQDVFNTKEKGYSQYTGVYTSHYVDFHHPVFSLTLTYSFNPAKSKYKGGSAGQKELNRLSQ